MELIRVHETCFLRKWVVFINNIKEFLHPAPYKGTSEENYKYSYLRCFLWPPPSLAIAAATWNFSISRNEEANQE
jgi:hypothetical protein